MENTLQNKTIFFAQYFGQEVFGIDDGDLVKINFKTIQYVNNESFLKLKCTSNISDDDAIHLISFFNPKISKTDLYNNNKDKEDFFGILCGVLKEPFDNEFNDPVVYQKIYDYLRLNGYCVPFMDLSIHSLLEYGWIKQIDDL